MMESQDFPLLLQFVIMNDEIWRKVPGYIDLFASNLGRLKRPYKNGKVHYIKGHINRHGYRVTSLYYDGKHQQFHRLVAIAFIPNPNNKPFIDHINGVRDDNRVENLRWCTHTENNNFPLAKRNRSKSIRAVVGNIVLRRTLLNRCNAEKRVCQLSINGELIRVHSSIANAAKYLGDLKYNPKIVSVCKGKRKSAYGYRWCYYYEVEIGVLSLLI